MVAAAMVGNDGMMARGFVMALGLALAGCAAKQSELMVSPPPTAPGLPVFSNAPTVFGTEADPAAFGPATARIEGNTFYILTANMDHVNGQFSRRISYDPISRRLTSSHRDLDLVYDEAQGAFVGTIRHPATRQKLRVVTTVPASSLPQA